MKGDKGVLEFLNKALRSELTAINQYVLHAHLLEDWGLDRLYQIGFAHAKDEMHHAETIIKRILFLGGHPEMQQLDDLLIGKDVKGILENDRKAEEYALKLYREAAAHCEKVQDYATRDLFTGLITDEEKHFDFLDTELGLIDKMGLENYQQSQARGE
ncbi:bacterioferritin [Natronospira bacteriovora]|uniref:Bacterioferritin n=1 Tax=Natronospira bacteriovora TaxID=3069753 RepID=A0ABU0WA71_9GAMM|nr:bacterioferritin [Natronospira sp. AB-CW4]MDQ2070823.1 bacterioferritin [Natronospira sp. AB-CW4]